LGSMPTVSSWPTRLASSTHFRVTANHAVQALGWGEGYILGQSSWGSGWGDGGRFKVALCVPTDVLIPGDIIEEEYPLLIPTATLTTSTSSPPPVNSTLPCMTHDDGCVTSPNWPEQYPNSQRCDISYKIGKLNVTIFEVERGYDFLQVNGEQFIGTQSRWGCAVHEPLLDVRLRCRSQGLEYLPHSSGLSIDGPRESYQ